jgi:hypothetical protein
MRWSLAAGLVLAAALTAGCGENAEPAPPASPTSAANTADISETRIVGATEAERQAVRVALAPLAGHSRIASVKISSDPVWSRHEGRAVTLVPAGPPAVAAEGIWQADLVVADLIRELRGADVNLAEVLIDDSHGYYSGGWPSALRSSSVSASAAQEAVVERAAEAGYDVREIVTYDVDGTVALRAVIRLTEEQLFDERGWEGTLFAGTSYPHYLRVEAPDGVPIFAGWSLGRALSSTGGSYFGAWGAAAPSSDPPPFLDGPTSLDVVLYRGLEDKAYDYEIGCQPEPHGIPDAASACDRLLRERWAFFPTETGTICSVPPGSDGIAITGTLGGRALERHYSPCQARVLQRWLELLGANPAQ